MASTWPAASIGSRTGKPTFSIVTLAAIDARWPGRRSSIAHRRRPAPARRASCLRSSFGLVTPRLLRADDREGRLVVDHEDRLDRHVRIGVAELDQRVDVAEAHVVGARRDAVDRLERAAGGVDRDVRGLRPCSSPCRAATRNGAEALEFEVEREFHRVVWAAAAPVKPSAAASTRPRECLLRTLADYDAHGFILVFRLAHPADAIAAGLSRSLAQPRRYQQRTCRLKEQGRTVPRHVCAALLHTAACGRWANAHL